jgi:hypothetical protein|tara:strand:- start:702 stop:881 length:180 start_codon:yes stop_codon:yes gene_type:complete
MTDARHRRRPGRLDARPRRVSTRERRGGRDEDVTDGIVAMDDARQVSRVDECGIDGHDR